MMLMHKQFLSPLVFKENQVQVLVVEHPALMRRFVEELLSQSMGEDGEFILSEDYTPLDCGHNLCVITDFFHLDLTEKRVQSRFTTLVKSMINDDLVLETQALMDEVRSYLGQVEAKMDYPIAYEVDSDVSALLKSFGFHLQLSEQSLIERLIDYCDIMSKLSGVRFFVLVNTKTIFNREELMLFYQTAAYKKWNLLLLEQMQKEDIMPCEVYRIMDADLCDINVEL